MTASATRPKILPSTDRLRQVELVSRTDLGDATTEYFTKYYALHHLRSVAEDDPSLIEDATVSAIQRLFQNEALASQRQSRFFYRQAAEVLTTMMSQSRDIATAKRAMSSLTWVVGSSIANRHRAVVEAIGSLPTDIKGPQLTSRPIHSMPCFSWQGLLDWCGYRLRPSQAVVIGRSLVFPLESDSRRLVVKLAKKYDPLDQLVSELDWLNCLNRHRAQLPESFLFPRGLNTGGEGIFRLASLPVVLPDQIAIHPELAAIAFLAPDSYFNYPNTGDHGDRPEPETFASIMRSNAYLFARLTSLGMIHTAPIALFHNRIQVERRRDEGRYEWFRAGRLDRWLESCDYPNLGASGPRDFEHLISFNGSSQALYRHIGTHLLSLLLVAGSYFRNKSPQERGLLPDGTPVDARHLFDHCLYQRVIQKIFSAYYEGFVGAAPPEDVPLDICHLTKRLIDELGVDRYMDEVLRVTDQNQMTVDEFRQFVDRCNLLEQLPAQGKTDLLIQTGPHLGAFNQSISVPELIEAVGTMAAWCVAGRYWRRRFDRSL